MLDHSIVFLPVQLERVRSESVCRFVLKTLEVDFTTLTYFRKIDNADCLVGAFLHTNTTSNAQLFRDETDLGGRLDFYAQLPHLHKGTVSLTFQIATARFTLAITSNPPHPPFHHPQ